MTITKRVKQLLNQTKETNTTKLILNYYETYQGDRTATVRRIINMLKSKKKVRDTDASFIETLNFDNLDALQIIRTKDGLKYLHNLNKRFTEKFARKFCGLYRHDYKEIIKLNKETLKKYDLI